MKINQQICQAELDERNLIPRKYYGQVFTTDEKVIDELIESIKSIYKPGTKIVEIGGGLGYITERLIEEFDDIDCVEFDNELFEILVNKFCTQKDVMNKNCIQVESPILNTNIVHKEKTAEEKGKTKNPNKKSIHSSASEAEKQKSSKNPENTNCVQCNNLRLIKGNILDYQLKNKNYLLVGNIPFHISGKLYRKFMSEIDHKPYGMVFITDKQYAKTLMGQPPRCYRVSLQAQSYGDIEIITDVPPSSVYPEPKVTSCIMKITQNDTELPKNFWETVNRHWENFPTEEVKSPKTIGLKMWIELCEKG